MSRQSAQRRPWAYAARAAVCGAVLAATVTTVAAAETTAQPPSGPTSAACEAARSAVDRLASVLDTAQGDLRAANRALDAATAELADAREDAGTEITEAEQARIDAAVAATQTAGTARAAAREAVRIARAELNQAIERRDRVCAPVIVTPPPTTTAPPVSLPERTQVVICVIRPGTCTEAVVDSDGDLVSVIRDVDCGDTRLPPITGTRKGQRVTQIRRVTETYVPLVVVEAPPPRTIPFDLPVTG